MDEWFRPVGSSVDDTAGAAAIHESPLRQATRLSWLQQRRTPPLATATSPKYTVALVHAPQRQATAAAASSSLQQQQQQQHRPLVLGTGSSPSYSSTTTSSSGGVEAATAAAASRHLQMRYETDPLQTTRYDWLRRRSTALVGAAPAAGHDADDGSAQRPILVRASSSSHSSTATTTSTGRRRRLRRNSAGRTPLPSSISDDAFSVRRADSTLTRASSSSLARRPSGTEFGPETRELLVSRACMDAAT